MLQSKQKEEKMVLIKEPYEFIRGKYKLSAFELKLLSYLFGKVDPQKDKEFKKYVITVKEIQEVFNKNYGEIYQIVKNSFKNLMNIKIELECKDSWSIFTIVVDPTILKRDGTISFYISPNFLELLKTSKHYLEYDISILAYFNSAYSVRLYKILKDKYEISKKFKKENIFAIDLEEFKELLGIPIGYKFGKIKEKVLNKALDEINKYSDIKVSFDEIKKGRKVESLKFYIQENTQNPAPAATPKALPTNSQSSKTPTTDLKQFRTKILGEYNDKDKSFLIEEKEFKIKNNLLYVDNKCLSAADGLIWWNYIYNNRNKIKKIDPEVAHKEALKELDEELKKVYVGKETFIGIKGEYTPVKIVNVTLHEDWEHATVIFQDSEDKNYKAVYGIEALKSLIS